MHPSELQSLIRADLELLGYCLVEGFGDDSIRLLRLAKSFGKLSHQGLNAEAMAAGLIEHQHIHLVRDCSTPLHTPRGQVVKSTSHCEFPLHTDEYFAEIPSRYVFLLCSLADIDGKGLSKIAHIPSVLSIIPKKIKDTLGKLNFPHPLGRVRLVTKNGYFVRFNLDEIQLDLLTPVQLQAVEVLSESANNAAISIALTPGDLLVIDNWRALHGRTAFTVGGLRLLKRVRVK